MKKLTLLLALASTAFAAERPNVLFIAIDDLRPELAAYGGTPVQTPHIDRLASQGTLFSRAYCQVPVCGASRASLMTGVLPTAKRFVSFSSKAEVDAPNATTLPQAFREAGYTTLTIGKIFHHAGDTKDRSWSEAPVGFGGHSESFDPETKLRLSEKAKRGRIYEAPDVSDDAYPDGRIALKAMADLQRLKEAGQPFFLAAGFFRPHLPFYAPKKYWDLYERDKIEIADNRYRPRGAPEALTGSTEYRSYHLADYDENSEDFHRLMRHGYLASVSYVDKLVGNVLAELERLDLAENTIVVLWGDHGFHLGEHNFWGKHNTAHLATRVPLIVRVPGQKPGSTASLVETIDIFPTLCSLAGIPIPDTVQGRSFEAILKNPEQPFREVAYSRYGSGDAAITEQFSYTSYHNGKSEMLFDLKTDPAENQNVATQPEYAETVAKMKRLLEHRKAEAAAAKIFVTEVPKS